MVGLCIDIGRLYTELEVYMGIWIPTTKCITVLNNVFSLPGSG